MPFFYLFHILVLQYYSTFLLDSNPEQIIPDPEKKFRIWIHNTPKFL